MHEDSKLGLRALSEYDPEAEARAQQINRWWLKLYAVVKEMEGETDRFAHLVRAAADETHREHDRWASKARPHA